MGKKVIVCVLILLMQACGPLLAQTAPPEEEDDSPGILQTVAEKVREAKAHVQTVGGVMVGFAGAYYEDHIKPVTDPYVEWASDARDSVWERFRNYMPFKQDESR